MCGIFGVVLRAQSGMPAARLEGLVSDLFKLSESRGREAAGLAIQHAGGRQVHKAAVSASELIRSEVYRRAFDQTLRRLNGPAHRRPTSVAQANGHHNTGAPSVAIATHPDQDETGQAGSAGPNGHPANGSGSQAAAGPVAIIGHSRLVTNGAQELEQNNQPLVGDRAVVVHNGIICNDESIWDSHPHLTRTAQIDTEVLLRLLESRLNEGATPEDAAKAAFAPIEGTASIAALLRRPDALLLATNNGSLYTARDAAGSVLLFASERYILEQIAARRRVQQAFGDLRIEHCSPNTARLVQMDDLATVAFSLSGLQQNGHGPSAATPGDRLANGVRRNARAPGASRSGLQTQAPQVVTSGGVLKLIDEGVSAVPELRRCTRCILPETMPFIEFDREGVCNYCRNYTPLDLGGPDALARDVERFRRPAGQPDSVLALSGGRDSTYALHYVKTVLGLNPIAYTYDWGMVTDLARRNQARICGKLGVEHILVSADINKKRANIRKNVLAWLRRPDLGTVPLFMAGDKQFFYHANRLRGQVGVDALIFSMNPLERTDFKTGYCGIARGGIQGRFYGLTRWNKLKLAWYYARQYAGNPAYLNSSLLDTIGAYCSYYVIPQDYLQFYHYIRWDEEIINRVLIDEYDWEVASDTNSTWRIGDGTAAFYNYIYYTVSGFSENDTFRSNQIREGVLDRESALKSVKVENQPRVESMQWYCDIIGIDLERALRVINAMPRRFDSPQSPIRARSAS